MESLHADGDSANQTLRTSAVFRKDGPSGPSAYADSERTRRRAPKLVFRKVVGPDYLRAAEQLFSEPEEPAIDSETLAGIEHEITVAAVIAADMLDRRTINEETWTRLATAVARLAAVRRAAE